MNIIFPCYKNWNYFHRSSFHLPLLKHLIIYRFKKNWRTSVLFVGPLVPLFWSSGDVCHLYKHWLDLFFSSDTWLDKILRSNVSWVMVIWGPPVNRQTDMIGNITFPQLHWQAVIKTRKHSSRICTAHLPTMCFGGHQMSVPMGALYSKVQWTSLNRSPVMATRCH